MGASEEERKEFKLLRPEDYLYLKQASYLLTLLPSQHPTTHKPDHHQTWHQALGETAVYERYSVSHSYAMSSLPLLKS